MYGGFRVEDTGDAYIYCRDNIEEIKISFHKSGKQHVAFTKESGHEMTPRSRFWNQWREPPQQNPAVPTFKLVFPNWGIGLDEEQRKKAQSKWDKNQILIEGDDELLTVVSFFILDEGVTFRKQGGPASYPIAVLPIRPGKRLFAIAGKEPEGDLKAKVETAFQKIDVSALPRRQVLGKVISVCMTGDQPAGYAYMAMVPANVDYKVRQTCPTS